MVPPLKLLHYIFSHYIFLDSKRNTENLYQKNEVDAVAKPDHAVLKFLKSICGRNLEEFVKTG